MKTLTPWYKSPLFIFHVLTHASIIPMIMYAEAWQWIVTLIMYYMFGCWGVAITYHRLISHKSFEAPTWFKLTGMFLGSLGAVGSTIQWTAVHRDHHRHSDTDLDPHSPIHGFWHSYITWMFTLKEGDVSVRRVPDLLRDPDVVFVHKHYIKIVWIIYGLAALVDINLFFYLLVLPALITLHVFCLQTSVVHYTKLGYRNYQTKDNSINVPWLFLITQGECWHNNHHGNPKNPNYGSKHWWELDPTYWLIKLVRIHQVK